MHNDAGLLGCLLGHAPACPASLCPVLPPGISTSASASALLTATEISSCRLPLISFIWSNSHSRVSVATCRHQLRWQLSGRVVEITSIPKLNMLAVAGRMLHGLACVLSPTAQLHLTWSFLLLPVCSLPPTAPMSSVRRRSFAVWMSSSPALITNVPAAHSDATCGQPAAGSQGRKNT